LNGKLTMNVYDVLGRLIVEAQTLNTSNEFIDVRLPTLAAGMYHVLFRNGEDILIKDVVIY